MTRAAATMLARPAQDTDEFGTLADIDFNFTTLFPLSISFAFILHRCVWDFHESLMILLCIAVTFFPFFFSHRVSFCCRKLSKLLLMTLDDTSLSLLLYPSCSPVNKNTSWIMDYSQPKEVLGSGEEIMSSIGIT